MNGSQGEVHASVILTEHEYQFQGAPLVRQQSGQSSW